MRKLSAGTMAVVAVGVGVATWGALTLIAPHHREEVKLEGIVAPEAVFDDSAPAPAELAEAPEPAAIEPVDDQLAPEVAAPVAADLAPPPEEEDAPAPAPAKPVPAPKTVAESDVVAARPPPVITPAKPQAKAELAAAKPAPVVAPPAPKPEPAKPAPKPAAVAAAPKAEPKPKPADVATPAPAAAHKPASTPATAWWQGPENSANLQIVYVGSAAFKRAIVVMGSSAFASTASAEQYIAVIDAAGRRVAGRWEQSTANRSMLVMPVPAAGRYEVVIGGGLSDQQNRVLGATLRGSVKVE